MNEDPNEEITLLFDTKTRRPGCVILQTFANCGHNNEFMQSLGLDWETSMTPDLKVIRGTRAQWRELARREHAKVSGD